MPPGKIISASSDPSLGHIFSKGKYPLRAKNENAAGCRNSEVVDQKHCTRNLEQGESAPAHRDFKIWGGESFGDPGRARQRELLCRA